MSWIVESLLNDRHSIKEAGNIESDEFNDLMLVEKAIESLYKARKLNDEDVEILKSFPASGLTKMEKYTLSKKRGKLCQRVAYYMGGYFTDEGYLNHIQVKYKLTEAQVESLRDFIKSEYRNKIMRKPIND